MGLAGFFFLILTNCFYNLYIVRKDIPLEKINFDKGEMVEVKYFNKSEVQKILEKGNLTLTTAYNLEKYILKLL